MAECPSLHPLEAAVHPHWYLYPLSFESQRVPPRQAQPGGSGSRRASEGNKGPHARAAQCFSHEFTASHQVGLLQRRPHWEVPRQ